MNEKTAKLIARVSGGDDRWRKGTMLLWKGTPKNKRGKLRRAIRKHDRRGW